MTGLDEFFRLYQKVSMIGGVAIVALVAIVIGACILIKKSTL